jgi:ectoine hydroxylase-related dioxygenase (phytanoyl-CoA dioxygenase family)
VEARVIAGFPTLDFDAYHRSELPRLLVRGADALAAREASRRGALALQIEGGSAYTYQPRGGGIEVVPGVDQAQTVVALDRESWEGLVHDLETAPALIYSGRARKVRGDLMDFVMWEPALRALYQGIPVFDPGSPLIDADGERVNPREVFHLDDDPKRMSVFLHAAGYILVKSVFSRAQVDALMEEAEAAGERAVEGDQKSWWGKTSTGDVLLSRVTHAAVLPAMRRLPRDSRLLRIGKLPGMDLDPPSVDAEGGGVSVLWKWPDAVEGITNLPWHRDCGMGGHALNCPSFVCQVYLTPATREMGELRVLPGSHRAAYAFAEAHESVPGEVAVPAEAGDVSLHWGDVMHGTPPPTGTQGPYRVSLLLSFAKKGARNHRGDGHYNDVLLGREDGQIDSLHAIARRD